MTIKSMHTQSAFALLLVYLGISSLAFAQDQAGKPTQPGVQSVIVVQVRQYSFNLEPGGSYNLTLPHVTTPIRIEITNGQANGAVQEPSELMWALVNFINGNHVTWIGTNSDGTTSGSNSAQNTTIANIVCGPSCIIASLTVTDPYTGTLSLTQNATTTGVSGHYIVRMYY